MRPVPLMDDGLPLCSDRCPAFDGKRCELTGFRPDRVCEPFVRNLVAEVATLRAAVLASQPEG